MEIEHKDDGKKGAFLIKVDGDAAGEMTYVWAGPNSFIIDHTGVGDALRGKGAGKQLVEKAVEFARKKGVSIMPLCPFAKKVIESNPEFRDVL